MFGLLFAFLSPVLFAFSNIVDKYVIDRHVKDVLAFTSVTGFVSIFFGVILGAFLDWSQVTALSAITPAVVGILLGIMFFVYMRLLEKEDVSHVIGFAYAYPIIVALLAYVFLGERIPMLGYIGVMITILGALLLSLRLRKMNLRTTLFALSIVILFSAFSEFLVKVSTTIMPVWQGITISTIATGATLLFGLCWPSIRKNAGKELHNAGWAFLSDATLFLALGASYLAMHDLPATIVSSLATVQPLAVLVIERIIHARTGNMSRDNLLLPKLGSIALIVAGVVLLTIAS